MGKVGFNHNWRHRCADRNSIENHLPLDIDHHSEQANGQ